MSTNLSAYQTSYFDAFFKVELKEFSSLRAFSKYTYTKSIKFQKMITKAVLNGFSLTGKVESSKKHSKAYTNMSDKAIRIYNGFLSGEETVNEKIHRQILSIVYEITNALNHYKFQQIFKNARLGTISNGTEFAKQILRLEANSQFFKVKTARHFATIIQGFSTKSIKKIYLEILEQGIELSTEKPDIINEFTEEMIKNGKLKRSGILAIEHYKNLYKRRYSQERLVLAPKVLVTNVKAQVRVTMKMQKETVVQKAAIGATRPKKTPKTRVTSPNTVTETPITEKGEHALKDHSLSKKKSYTPKNTYLTVNKAIR